MSAVRSQDMSDAALAVEPVQVSGPLPDAHRVRLADYYGQLIAEAGADLPALAEVPPPGAARRSRRVARQRADRLVRVLSTVRGTASAAGSTGVAA